MLISCLLFALAGLMMLLDRTLRKDSMLFPFLCVLFCCAGVAAGVLSRGSLMTVGTGTVLVLLAVLITPERSGKS